MIGEQYSHSRKTLLQKMTGDSSWKYGKPEKAAAADEDGGGVPEETAMAEILADAALIHTINESFTENEAAADDSGGDTPEEMTETLADTELIHSVNASFAETDGEAEEAGDE